jgi:16S rRNA (cytidine1402-2'-O)-methyltransferase
MSTLYVIATPIGNLEDMTYRAVRVMGEVDALACEDTRHTRKLLTHFEIPRPAQVFACHQGNEARSSQGIVKLLDAGRTVGLVSDAGMPGISDPGYRVVAAAVEAGHRVEVIPGPSASTTALVASALPSATYTFLGFPPRKPGKRRKLLQAHAEGEATLVLFESPNRLAALLTEALEIFGDRRAAVSVELTKMFEDTTRGWLSELAERYADEEIRGEVTVTIRGNRAEVRAGAPESS